jgi:hypothetical protein
MSREAFEKVFSQPPYDWPMRKNSEGQYSSRRVQWTWEGWQAAQQHSGMVSVPEDTLIAACAYLTQAAEDIEAWGSYASDYFQKKYGLKDDIRLYKQRTSEFEAMAEAQEQQ